MDSIFSYDSKLVQMLIRLADLMLLNILFIICCIPLVTIGAAQTGLHSAIMQMQNKDKEESVYTAFFKGFANGFGKITFVYTLGLVLILLLIWATGIAISLSGNSFSTWMCVIACTISVILHSMLTPFHANFDCTPRQLMKNVYLMTLAHPLRAIANALLTWIPILVFLLDMYTFLRIIPVWVMLYYSTAFLFCHSVMKKPFNGLKEDFEERQRLSAEESEKTNEAEELEEAEEV